MPKSLKDQHTDDRGLRFSQDNTANVLREVLSNQLIDGIVLASVSLVSGDNNIEHLLGRDLIGWLPVRQSAAADLYDKQSTNDFTDRLLVINSSAIADVTFYVF